jgi:drug/metabolite transporter (DMT)-like permease
MKSKELSPYLGLLIGIAAVSTASIFIRFAQGDAPSFVIAAGRMLIASCLLAPFAFKTLRQELPQQSRQTRLLLLLGGVFLGAHFAAWITSLEFTSVASSVVIVTTAPLWVAILSPVLLKEKITRWVVAGLLISLVGSFIVGLSSACQIAEGQLACSAVFSGVPGKMIIGNLLALLGAFMSAGYLLVGRKIRNSLSLGSYTFSVYSIAALFLLLLVIVFREPVTGFSTSTYMFIIALALIPQIVGHSSFNWALKYLPAAMVSIALLGEPIGTIILSFLLLKESPTVFEVVGGILILLGILVASRGRGGQSSSARS